MAFASGHLRATDGAALIQRLDALAATVCEHDPRTTGAASRRCRRARWGAGKPPWPASVGVRTARRRAERAGGSSAVIHVLAEQGTLDGTSDAPGYLRGFGILPAESVREVATDRHPQTAHRADRCGAGSGVSAQSPGYKEFMQWRDLTCRWPGCDKPAEKSDIDHTVPYPCGSDASVEQQALLPDSSFDQDVPHRCRRLDRSAIARRHHRVDGPDRAHLHHRTPRRGDVPRPGASPPGTSTCPAHVGEPRDRPPAMMPRRKQTRAQDRHDRINAERRERTELIAEEERQRQAWLAANYQPPPF